MEYMLFVKMEMTSIRTEKKIPQHKNKLTTHLQLLKFQGFQETT